MKSGFGDRVRIVATPETERAGLARLAGNVLGETKPSVSGVPVIGGAGDDFALQVQLDGRGESHWFTLDLVRFVDPASEAGSVDEPKPPQRPRPRTEEWQEKDLPSSGW